MDAILQDHCIPEVCLQHALTTDGTSPGDFCAAIYPAGTDYPAPAHYHSQLEFVFVLRGRVVEQVGDRSYVVYPGQLIWHLPGVAHAMTAMSTDFDFRVVYIQPDVAAHAMRSQTECGGCFDGWLEDLARMVSGRPVVELCRRDLDTLIEHTELARHTPCSASLPVAELLAQVAIDATRRGHDDRQTLSFAELASGLLMTDPALTRSEVCRALDVSTGHLSRSFKKGFGLSFQQARTRARIVRFVARATRERLNLLHAALGSGFGSYSQAHRVFTSTVGMSPRDFLHAGGRQRIANQLGSPFRRL